MHDAHPSSLLPLRHATLGHGLRDLWLLERDIHFLNHGSFGATPRHVLAAQTHWRQAMERQPVRFMADELPDALLHAGERLARTVGATPSRLVLVENATAGANAVLRSIRWKAGERIVIANHAYPAIKSAARFVAERHGLTLIEAQVPWPLCNPEALVSAYEQAMQGGARLAIVDHVFSPLAIVTPVEAVVQLCRDKGIQVLVDGAHAPGMLPLSLDALGADWYVGNCHKWLYSPKGCAFLVATPEGQVDLHPSVISSYYGHGYKQEFSWTGTGDPSARLAVTAALDFIDALGFERYFVALREQARTAAKHICTAWGVEPGAPFEMFGAMVTIPLPLKEAGNEETARRWHDRLREEHRIEVPVFPIEGRLWVRISAQVYNELSDYEALAQAFL